MALTKQSKVLTPKQIKLVLTYLESERNSIRNKSIFLLSVKSGMRSKEIASLQWGMLMNSQREIGDSIHLTNTASKGKNGGRIIPINNDLKTALLNLFNSHKKSPLPTDYVVTSMRSKSVSSQTVINMFQKWYGDLGFDGCSSHSGRRTAITQWAKRITECGGSLRDVQLLCGHSSLQTTQRYIEMDTEAQRKVIEMV